MIVPYALVTALVVLSMIFSAISLFTYGWAYIYPFNPFYEIIPSEEILLGLVPFDSSALGWLVATSIFMYLNFTCALFCFLICVLGMLLFMLRGDSHYQKFVFVILSGSTFLTALFGAIAFVIFVASYSDSLSEAFEADVSIGYSPFVDLIGFVAAAIATGVSAFFAIALLNSNEN